MSVVEVASRITNPIALAAFTVAFLGMALYAVVRIKGRPVVWLLAFLTATVGIAPVATRTYLSARGVYRVSVVVLDQNSHPIADAELRTLPDARKEHSDRIWMIEIPPQTRPADGKLAIFASVPNAFLAGETTILLGSDYFPTAQIHMLKLQSVTIRGRVQDERGLAVSGATVTIPACSLTTETQAGGLFHIESCVAAGQMVKVQAQKDTLTAEKTEPSDGVFDLTLSK